MRGTQGRGTNGFEGIKHLSKSRLDVVSAISFPLAPGKSGVVSLNFRAEALP